MSWGCPGSGSGLGGGVLLWTRNTGRFVREDVGPALGRVETRIQSSRDRCGLRHM